MSNLPKIFEEGYQITGRDIHDLMLRNRLNARDVAELLGIAHYRLAGVIEGEGVLDNVTLSMLVRIYNAYPQLIERPFDINELLEQVSTLYPPDQDAKTHLRNLSILFGRDRSTAYRWLKEGCPSVGSVGILGKLLRRLPGGLYDLKQVAIDEALSRGVNPWKTGSWTENSLIDTNDPTLTCGRRDL